MSQTTTEGRTTPRLKQRYDAEIRAKLQEQLGLGNVMQVPRLEKIVINMGVGAAVAPACHHAIYPAAAGAVLGHARGNCRVGAQRAFDGCAGRFGQLAVDECNQEFVREFHGS